MIRPFLPASLALLPLLLAAPLSAHEVLLHADAESAAVADLEGAPLPRTDEAAHKGGSSYVFEGRSFVTLAPLIPVDPQKTYRVSAWMRSASEETPASANFGVMMYDAEKRPISLSTVIPFADTDTELLAPVSKGDRELLVRDAAEWVKHEHSRIAFHVKEDLSDLPNHQLSPMVSNVEKTDAGWRISLKEPIDADYPKGTAVRTHSPWGPGLYWVADEWVPTTWKEYSATLHGMALAGIPGDQFWAGTRYVRVQVRLGNWNRVPKEGARLLVDEIRFEEVPPEARQPEVKVTRD